MYQNGVLVYGVANKTALKNLKLHQNFLIQFAFRLKKTQELRIIKKTHGICSINE